MRLDALVKFLPLTMIATVFAASQTFVSQGPAPSIDPFFGPNNTDTGAVQPVVVSPGDPNTLFIGGVNGGIWGSSNFGTSWTPLTDHLNSLSIASLSFDPTDSTNKTLIAGVGTTSNGLLANSVRGGQSLGVLYTTNEGNSWSPLAGNTSLAGQSVVGVIARGSTLLAGTFEPQNPTLATSLGLYRSTDTGATFAQVAVGPAGSPVTSLIGDANPVANPNSLYAAITNPTTLNATALYHSTDGGQLGERLFLEKHKATGSSIQRTKRSSKRQQDREELSPSFWSI